jgi:hypothetical protein
MNILEKLTNRKGGGVIRMLQNKQHDATKTAHHANRFPAVWRL